MTRSTIILSDVDPVTVAEYLVGLFFASSRPFFASAKGWRGRLGPPSLIWTSPSPLVVARGVAAVRGCHPTPLSPPPNDDSDQASFVLLQPWISHRQEPVHGLWVPLHPILLVWDCILPALLFVLLFIKIKVYVLSKKLFHNLHL
ncbi:unnamed protein product [Musa acuminata subsp. malaccensis]|uniref:(wild Malaysian banana) hypothetical protein n=1 Tax=Musa acuminata subsp. malaccensis TaxID=214687 RepID=A0A804KSA0_MUSAM|nr:unnamed protein product [Musa acuminata subsp. malaccensis]